MKVLLAGVTVGPRGIGQMEIRLDDEQLDEFGLRDGLTKLLERTARQLNEDPDSRWRGRIAGLELVSIDVIRILQTEMQSPRDGWR